MYRQAPSFAYHDLGIVEDGDTASQAIEKDKFVIWKGASYFASTDILQGATLEEDVNLTAIPDGVINGVVSALNNNTPNIISNENGVAYQFPSGFQICVKEVELSVTCTKAWGNMYEDTSDRSLGNWAASFISTPIVVGSANKNASKGGSFWTEYIANQSTTSAGVIRCARATSASGSALFSVVGYGTWK